MTPSSADPIYPVPTIVRYPGRPVISVPEFGSRRPVGWSLVRRCFHGVPFTGLQVLSRGQKINANFFVQSFSTTLRVMDVRAENRGRPHQKVRFSAAPVMGRNFLTPGHPGVRVRNVRGKSGPKSLCLCCFSSLIKVDFHPQFGGEGVEPQKPRDEIKQSPFKKLQMPLFRRWALGSYANGVGRI